MTAGRRKRGTVLLFAVAAVVLVTTLATALTVVAVNVSRAARRAELDARLLNTAESGAEVALHRLAGSGGRTRSSTVSVPGGRARLSFRGLPGGKWLVTSNASAGGMSRQVRITARLAGMKTFRVLAWESSRRNSP